MNNQLYYCKVWHGSGNKITGEVIDIHTYQELLRMHYVLWSFTGRTATVCVVTIDDKVTRSIALDFATMFMQGTYVTISVDLANLTSTITKGNPPPCY